MSLKFNSSQQASDDAFRHQEEMVQNQLTLYKNKMAVQKIKQILVGNNLVGTPIGSGLWPPVMGLFSHSALLPV